MIISREPFKLEDWVEYKTRSIKCARCSAVMPAAPWPTNSTEIAHHPRCGICGSAYTYPQPEKDGVAP